MNNVQARVALLTGVSISMLGLAAPAAAATVPGIQHSINDSSVDDTLTISAIGDDAAFYGVTVDGTALAYAIVQDVNSGEIVQGGNATTGDVTLLATNGGDVTVGAVGHALNTAGSAAARGHVERAIYQFGKGPQQAALDLQNSGDIAVVANGIATGTAALGLATISTAILQIADGSVASVALTNDGEIDIDATAVANATAQNATAIASVHGIAQTAHGYESGLVSLSNAGAIDIAANASADGFVTGDASAKVQFGVWQSAWGSATDGFAGVSLDNSGTIAIDVNAAAEGEMSAHAAATLETAVYQHATASRGGASAILTNSGTIALAGIAVASAHNGGSRADEARATAMVGAIDQSAIAKTVTISSSSSGGTIHANYTVQPHGPVSVGLDNSGTISLFANAAAVADDDAFALGAVTVAMQVAEGTSATVTLTNSGDISATAEAAASGAHLVTALAFASGLHQTASAHMTHQSLTVTAGSAGHYSQLEGGVGPASVSMTNSGTISLDAHGVAAAGTPGEAASSTSAFAAALGHIGIGILQQSFGSEASASLENSGTISFAATATAVGAGGANAQAEVDGFTQVAIATAFLFSVNWAGSTGSILAGSAYIGPAVNEFDNSGTFDVTAVGKAEAGGFANANVHATGGLQLANGSSASIVLDNSGTFNVLASGEAAGASGFAFAAAHGVAQWEKGADAASMQVINSGTVSIDAEARGTASQGSAVAAAQADGFSQSPLSLATATASVSNSGEIDIKANAAAAGNTLAYAFANAEGVIQEPLFGNFNANFANDGTVDIAAVASASASGAAYASARATGYYEDAGNVTADVVNSGTMTISASAVAHGSTGSAYAFAGGITMVAANHMSSTTVSAGLLGGSIVNSGELDVSAKVDSDNGGTAGATATGIYLLSTRNDATVVNSGTIDVAAVTAHGGAATAWGVRVLNAMRGDAPTADDLFTFTNDGGTIIARHSTDGGETWQRGMAIDVSDAPNASVINLTGNGAIYGNVAIQAGDDINVADGTTYFDGIINPQSMPLNGIHAVDLDSGLAGVGTLNIQDGGNLVLADPKFTGDSSMYDGPAYALVDTLNMDAGGTLTFELQPMAGGTQPAGSYPQIFADTANLDGILVADVTTANGLFADSYAWNNVIDANTLSGKFDQCKLGGPNAGSVLLKFACSYDQANADVDLALTRVAFDQVAGLNSNGAAAGAGLECIYDDSLTGGAATMFADLFLIKDSAKYDVALNQLSGSAYANYLNSFPSLGAHYDDLVDHATDCEVPAVGGSILECRGGSPVHVWGQLDYQTRRADGDIEAGSSRSKRFTGMVGLDAVVGDSAILGFEAGYVTNHLRDRQFGDSIEGKGAQAGIYAAYDPGAFFVKGMTTFSWFNGDSTRHVDFTGLATGATFKGTPTAHPDANLWTFGLHGGARFGVGESSVVTPYLNLDYAMSRFNGFTETGLEGADLSVETSHSNRTFVTGGIKWAARLGGVVPEVNLGYRYRFGNERSRIAAFFSGDSDCDFDVVSAAQRKGAFLAGVSVGGKLGPVDVRIGYEGEFNRDVTSHSGNFKLVLPLGGHAAPPPPVAVAAPLAAPEPAPTEVAPTPAPAPVERGERGR